MSESKEHTLPSGAKLKITLAPFKDARNLLQACMSELKELKIDGDDEIDHNLLKDIFCSGISSKKIEEALDVCMTRVLYNNEKISEDTFEPEKARGDYLMVQYLVAKENLFPFGKGLYAEYAQVFTKIKTSLQ